MRKTGETDVEVTTGALDMPSAQAPGAITRVQIATIDGQGRRLTTKDYSNLTTQAGYLNFVYSGLPRGQILKIDANVVGVDVSRTDVVSATPKVKLRPDLIVQGVSAPPQTLTGAPVVIAAIVAERNQDVGARATCALAIDGVEVDRTEGVWVDAGGLVTCAFTHVFDTTGVKTLSVYATDVTPSDYDPDNNAAATSILIRKVEPFDYTFADTLSIESRYGWRLQTSWTRENGLVVSGRDTEDDTLRYELQQYVGYYAEVSQPVDYPVSHFTATESTDGVVLRSVALDNFELGPQGCILQVVGADRNVYVNICSTRQTDGSGRTVVQYQSFAGEVTYFSRGYDLAWHRSEDGSVTTDSSYSWNDRATVSQTGSPAQWGATYTIDVTVTSGMQVFHGPATMALMRDTASHGIPWFCLDTAGDWGTKRECGELTDLTVKVSGYVNVR
jgi:hypothetical protein